MNADATSSNENEGEHDHSIGTVTQKYDRLHDKLDKTARSRFIAARRYELHETLSLYTVVLMSCAVIALTLFDGLGMLADDAMSASSFLQVFCAVGVLVYSVILSKSDFALKAYRHHECAVLLNKVRSTVFKHTVDEPKSDQYAKSAAEYTAILERFENHLNLDFKCMQVQTKTYHNEYNVTRRKRLWVWLQFSIVYWHYILFSALAVTGPISVYVAFKNQ